MVTTNSYQPRPQKAQNGHEEAQTIQVLLLKLWSILFWSNLNRILCFFVGRFVPLCELACFLRGGVEEEIDHGRRVQREQLAHHQATNERDAEWPPQLRSGATTKRERQRAEQRRHRRHHDRTKAQQTRLKDRFFRILAMIPLRVEREVDHHDRVLLHDADQKNDADDADNRELSSE